MNAKLVVVGGETKTPEVRLKLPAVLGRGREATLALPHPLVSRQHCEIFEADDGRLWVRDLGSLNGTFVANQRIEESPLDNGQLLTVGTVTFRAVYLDDTGQPLDSGDSAEFVPAAEAAPSASPTSKGTNEETVPAPTAAPSEPTPAADGPPTPPMAMPIEQGSQQGSEAGSEQEEDDDLSAFFESLK